MKIFYFILIGAASFFLLAACNPNKQNKSTKMPTAIPDTQVKNVIRQIKDSLGNEASFRIERGVQQVSDLWREQDGSPKEFADFCKKSFVADTAQLSVLFNTLQRNFEVLYGYFHKIDEKLKEPLHLEGPEITAIDLMFGGYDVSAHLGDDMFASKIAFLSALNFPFYSLEEKTKLGENWTRKEWAYARMGDAFTTRVPAQVQQNISKTLTEADAYISDYNIYMGKLLNSAGQHAFPEEMKLITHWGLRDELKSNYDDAQNGLAKQRMVYRVMRRIHPAANHQQRKICVESRNERRI